MGNLDFQKLLFLYCRESDETGMYDFVPYKFGGFSFTSYADRRRLIERGLLDNEPAVWKLTEAGKGAARIAPTTRMSMDQFARRNAGIRGRALVAATYRRHPYYAIRSKIAARVLASDAAALQAIVDVCPAPSRPGLCTIGYEGHTLESYLNLLILDGVTQLCDVRRNPLSRKYGFSKRTLSNACEGVGIRYAHLATLGIASEERRNLVTQQDYDVLFAFYERKHLPQQSKALSLIQAWVEAGERVALTCYERLPQQCHRHCIAKELLRRAGRLFVPKHL